METQTIDFTRVNNDVNGNPRYVCSYDAILNEADKAEARRMSNMSRPMRFFVDCEYELAVKKAKKIGGRKFHNKQYGGGLVFQSYDIAQTERDILNLRNA